MFKVVLSDGNSILTSDNEDALRTARKHSDVCREQLIYIFYRSQIDGKWCRNAIYMNGRMI